jgi:hypothetical protein
MEPSDIAAFRERFRISLIELLALKNAFATPLLIEGKSIDESRDIVKEWLDRASATADQAYGQHFQEPGMVALYADEVKEVVENMKAQVDKIAERMKE